jgi:hypothetical protein
MAHRRRTFLGLLVEVAHPYFSLVLELRRRVPRRTIVVHDEPPKTPPSRQIGFGVR